MKSLKPRLSIARHPIFYHFFGTVYCHCSATVFPLFCHCSATVLPQLIICRRKARKLLTHRLQTSKSIRTKTTTQCTTTHIRTLQYTILNAISAKHITPQHITPDTTPHWAHYIVLIIPDKYCINNENTDPIKNIYIFMTENNSIYNHLQQQNILIDLIHFLVSDCSSIYVYTKQMEVNY